PELVAEALAVGRVMEVRRAKPHSSGSSAGGPEPQGIAPPDLSDRQAPEEAPVPPRPALLAPLPAPARRPAIPTDMLRQLYARAQGRCEDCGRRDVIVPDHVVPFSDRPVHILEDMRMRCQACHSLRH